MQHSKIRRLIVSVILVVIYSACAWPQEHSKKPASSIAAAQAEISRGQLDHAEKTLWEVLSSDPNHVKALTLLGVIRGRQKRYAEAESLLRRVVQLDSKSLVAHRNLASCLIAQNKQEEAIEQYKKVMELAPQDDEARVELARLYVASGQFNEALLTLDRIPKERLPPHAIPAKAASLLALGRREEAAALIPSVKRSSTVGSELAEVFLDGNAPELAKKVADEALSGSQPGTSRLYYLRGRALQAMGEAPAALKSFDKALARDPNSVDTLLAMAAIQASENEHKSSLVLLKRAYRLQPESPHVLRPLVIEAIKAGEPRTASHAAHILADKNPENLDDLYLASAAMLEGQDFATAASIFDKYVKERPDDSKGFLGLGISEFAQQHYPEARRALERAIQIDPNSADAEYQLGILADRQGAVSEAIQHFERTVQLQTKNAKALANLGGEYLQAGDVEKARAALERSVIADPNNPKAQYNLALALSKLGRTEEAKQHMDRSRALQIAEELGKNPAPVRTKP